MRSLSRHHGSCLLHIQSCTVKHSTAVTPRLTGICSISLRLQMHMTKHSTPSCNQSGKNAPNCAFLSSENDHKADRAQLQLYTSAFVTQRIAVVRGKIADQLCSANTFVIGHRKNTDQQNKMTTNLARASSPEVSFGAAVGRRCFLEGPATTPSSSSSARQSINIQTDCTQIGKHCSARRHLVHSHIIHITCILRH